MIVSYHLFLDFRLVTGQKISKQTMFLSALIGWMYVILWGVANYPPIFSNFALKSIQGISIDYIYFNNMGFVLYTLYTGMMLLSPLIREEFFIEHGEYPLIRLNDLFFGIHNLATNSFIMSQFYCWGFKKNDNQKLSGTAKFILSIVILYLTGGSFYIYYMQGFEPISDAFNWVHLFTSLGLVKIFMSVCKNIPQIMYNYNRKSTHGWPILMIWFDFTGALFSFVQLLVDAHDVNNMWAIFNNKPKLFLAVQVFIADSIFFFQHYYLYYEKDVKDYGPFKTDTLAGYGSVVTEDEQFLLEHAHDHDHLTEPVKVCTVSNTNKDELQRLIN